MARETGSDVERLLSYPALKIQRLLKVCNRRIEATTQVEQTPEIIEHLFKEQVRPHDLQRQTCVELFRSVAYLCMLPVLGHGWFLVSEMRQGFFELSLGRSKVLEGEVAQCHLDQR